MASQPVELSRARTLRAEMQHQLDLVESAIALVANGGARRATLVLPHADLVLPEAQSLARERGVVVRAVWQADGACDVIVEPIA
jgi:hypothetical protein